MGLTTSSKVTRILGLDPGLGRMGFGLLVVEGRQPPKVEGWGVITTTIGAGMGERLLELYNDTQNLITQLKPDVSAVETLFFISNTTTALPVAQARGILLLSLQQHQVQIAEYSPLQVKKAITGYGKATKPEVTTALVQRLNLEAPPRPDDAVDGLALAVTHWQAMGSLLTV
jgi:crossover junction endodeoxyribonuclease RuvC